MQEVLRMSVALKPKSLKLKKTFISFNAVVNRLVITMLLCAMFLEWLFPLTNLANEGEVVILRWFALLTACLLLSGCFKFPFALNTILPIIYVAIVLMMIYGHGFSLAWYWDLFTIVEQDILNIINTGDWHNLSAESRALVLLIGWSMLVLSVQKLVIGKKSILLFLFITIFYLLLLQVYTEASVLNNLYRTVAEGLLLQVWLFIFGTLPEENSKTSSVSSMYPLMYPLQAKRWLIGSMIIVLGCVTGSIYLSKHLYVPRAVPYSWQETIQAFGAWGEAKNQQSNVNYGQSESGYSQNDRVLGSPLTLRHDPYFIAVSPVPTYWRGESKDYYNGQGWQSMTTSKLVTNTDAQPELGVRTDGTPEMVQRIIFVNPIQQQQVLFTGGTPLRVPTLYSGQSNREQLSVPIQYDAIGQSLISAQPSSMVKSYQSYDITVTPQPIVSENLRQNERKEQNERNAGEDPAWVTQHYLQLPEALPKRISSLAEQLTSNTTNRYDAVMAIKHYLEKNYRYELKTTLPSAKQDFVDHFLFEQKAGYCDHFSTSMVVLLRSNGIPARWVKGFAPGSLLTTTSEQRDGAGSGATISKGNEGNYDNRYLVSYADAHSWVEVYFEGVGFVPFDPTPGYDGKVSVMNSDQLINNSINTSNGNSREINIGNLWTSLASWWRNGSAHLQTTLVQLQFIGEQMLAYILRHPIAVTVVVILPIMIALIMAGINRYGGAFALSWSLSRQRIHPFHNHISFPTRDILLFSATLVWNKLSQRYGEKQGMLTPREYVQQIITLSSKIDEKTKQRLLQFIPLWEQLYYGRATLSRQETTTFLTLCWSMVKPTKYTL